MNDKPTPLASKKESQEDRARRIMEHDYPVYRDFFERYGLGPKWPPPSCLVCGEMVVEPAVKHVELAGIVVCQRCKTASDAAKRSSLAKEALSGDSDSGHETFGCH